MAVTPAPNYSKVIEGGSGFVIATTTDGKTVKVTGPRNWRNNNPGNLINAPAGLSQYIIGRDKYKDPVFDTYEHGLEAQRRLLFVPNSTRQNYASKTLRDAMYTYTPPVVEVATGQKGDPDKYIKTIIAGVPGINANTVLSTMSATQQQQMIDVIHKVEGYKAGKVEVLNGTPQTPPVAPKPSVEPPVEVEVTNINEYRVLPGEEGQFRYDPNKGVLDVTKPLENILHNYPSYTYSLSLHLLNPDEYNNIVAGIVYTPKRVLVAGAGKYNQELGINQFTRSQYFADDFYFDNLEFSTVIGVNSRTRNTNAIEFNFTLVEPYGMTLINRLLDQANDPEMNCSNYLDMIYLLQIDFYANDDQGNVVGAIPGTTKRFPIKLTQMNIDAGVNGSKYQINAVPYNHLAYEQSIIAIPANMEIVAGSVSEFFQSGQAINPKSQVTSLSGALNGWQQDLVKNNKQAVADSFSFDVNPQIAQSLFTSAKQLASRDTSMADLTNTQALRQGNLGNNTSAFDAQTRTFSLNAGTSIDKVIDYVVRGSDYIKNQITIPDGMNPEAYLQEKAKNANTPLNWFKIVPSVTVGDYDPVRKVYAKNITYHVEPYTIYNVKSDVAPQGKIDKFVKVYNYIYTGKNNDIIDFNINFNTLYYTAQTAYRSAVTSLFKKQTEGVQSADSQNSQAYQGSDQKRNSVMPMVVKPTVYNAKARATGGSVDPKAVAVADLEDSLMTLSSADMLSVQLKIVGDPQFLKQDDCFYTPLTVTNGLSNDPRLTVNGSIRTDYSEIYVQLYFRTPVDINEDNGMYDFGNKYTNSVFSGVYRVLTVQSNFAGGLFTQTLDLIRLPYQPNYDYVGQAQQVSDQRSKDISSTSMITKNATNNINVAPIPKLNKVLEATDLRSAQQQLAQKVSDALPVDQIQRNLKNVVSSVKAVPIKGSDLGAISPFRGKV